MKKVLLYSFALLATFATFSCTDKDEASYEASSDRLMTPVFRTNRTVSKGGSDPYLCQVIGRNSMQLYWSQVKGAKGYQIKASYEQSIANTPENWDDATMLVLDTIVWGEEQDQMLLEDLIFSKTYRFAIRALSTLDRNIKGDETTFAHASNWYGHGSGRQWSEYMGISTDPRYPTPNVIYVNQAETTEETMHVYLHKTINEVGLDLNTEEDQEKLAAYYEHFNIDSNGKFGYKYLTVTPSPNNPNASVDEKWKKYEIQEEDYTRGYIVITGLSKNSTYVIDVIDPLISVPVDAKYNTVTQRSDGTPGEPILLSHEQLMA